MARSDSRSRSAYALIANWAVGTRPWSAGTWRAKLGTDVRKKKKKKKGGREDQTRRWSSTEAGSLAKVRSTKYMYSPLPRAWEGGKTSEKRMERVSNAGEAGCLTRRVLSAAGLSWTGQGAVLITDTSFEPFCVWSVQILQVIRYLTCCLGELRKKRYGWCAAVDRQGAGCRL